MTLLIYSIAFVGKGRITPDRMVLSSLTTAIILKKRADEPEDPLHQRQLDQHHLEGPPYRFALFSGRDGDRHRVFPFITYLLGTKRKRLISSAKLVMTGVAMGTFAMYALEETRLEFIQRWQSGELRESQWNYILILTAWLAVFDLLHG